MDCISNELLFDLVHAFEIVVCCFFCLANYLILGIVFSNSFLCLGVERGITKIIAGDSILWEFFWA